jgi:ppGpp synthetase/RelA/SpoT-type nucleotidyltranferase
MNDDRTGNGDGDGGDDDRLKEGCQAAAWRAYCVHQWLGPLLKDSAAAKRAYAFKGRVKSADDIYKKVLGRRKHEDAEKRKPNYEPNEVTDASGFRIVKLFNGEVPQSLDELLSLLRLKLKEEGEIDPASQGGRLKELVEIEFHTSRRIDDPLSIFKDVQAAVQKHGFKLEPPAQNAAGQGTASSYSSVHVLVACEVKDGKDGKVVSHSEIQLRSVFEEAWSEISHRLKYAPIKVARAAGPLATADSDHLSATWLHLDALKSLTDGCAQYADLINRQIQVNTDLRADRSSALPLDAADRSAQMFANYGVDVQEAAKRAYKQRSQAAAVKEPGARAAGFREAAELFQAAMNTFKPDRSEEDERLFDVLREEFAFCCIFSGNEELRSRSEKIYRELLEKRPGRVSVLLRLGQLRRDASDFIEAAKLMEDGLKAAKSNPDPDPDVQRQASWLLRRDLAYILWRMVDFEPARPDAMALLRRAVELSKEALEFVKTDEQFINSRQNYLHYVVDLWKRSPADQREGLASTGRRLLNDLRPKVVLNKWTIESLDTIARGEMAFGDTTRAVDAAKVVAQKLGERIAAIERERNCSEVTAFELLSRDERTMYVHAQQLLLATSLVASVVPEAKNPRAWWRQLSRRQRIRGQPEAMAFRTVEFPSLTRKSPSRKGRTVIGARRGCRPAYAARISLAALAMPSGRARTITNCPTGNSSAPAVGVKYRSIS